VLLDAMFRCDNADGSTVEKRKVNLRQAFQSGGKGASHISENAAADSRLADVDEVLVVV
jgi:hypothetical protein